MDEWAYGCGVRLQFIEPGKPIQNAFTDGNQLEDYCDGLPDEFANFP
jgi:hypothetical protein